MVMYRHQVHTTAAIAPATPRHRACDVVMNRHHRHRHTALHHANTTPPRQSFQLMYGNKWLGAWKIASDEVHSTRFVLKGLKPNAGVVFRVRALHEIEGGSLLWGEWGVGSGESGVGSREWAIPRGPRDERTNERGNKRGM